MPERDHSGILDYRDVLDEHIFKSVAEAETYAGIESTQMELAEYDSRFLVWDVVRAEDVN